jgi:uncharacterized membrane protein
MAPHPTSLPPARRLLPAVGAGLLLLAVYIAGHVWLTGDHLWIFQRLIAVTAAGALVISVVGSRLRSRMLEQVERLDVWLQASPARASGLLAILVLGYFGAWCTVTFLRHHYFHSSYDLAIMNQVVWNTSQGDLFARSIEVTNDLGDHVRPYLGLLSLVYLVLPSPYVLLTFQSLALALGAVPLYLLARRQLGSPTLSLAVALCFLAYPPLGFVNRFDFHIESLAVPLLIAAYERIDAGDLKAASLLMAVTLLCKENLGLTIAALGATAALFHAHRRFGLIWAIVGVTYSLAALLVVIPAFRGEPSDTLARYAWMGDSPSGMLWALFSQPLSVLRKLLTMEHLLTLLQLFAPLAFLPIVGWRALLPAAPTLAYNFLADWSQQTTIYTHYMAAIVPFVSIASVVGLRRLAAGVRFASPREGEGLGMRRLNDSIVLAATVMVAAVLASWVYQNPVTGNASVSVGNRTRVQMVPMGTQSSVSLVWSNDAAIREGLRRVPRDRGLLTTAHYAPHLSQRRWIEMIPRAPVLSLSPEAEVIFLNLRDTRTWNCDDYFATLTSAARDGFGVSFYRDDVILAQKGAGDPVQLKNILSAWPGCGKVE